ncbi:MAG: TonB family protein [Acidobacteriota bacterium]|nr:TonB family protein [Acidobacteriota bacterium]
MPHAAILDEREPLGKPLAGSVAAHIGIAGAFLLSFILTPRVETFGDKTASSGSVGISITHTIPIPKKDGRVNRLATDTTSVVPQAPPKKKEAVKAPPPDPRAIPIPSRNAPRRPAPEQANRAIYKPEPVRQNQVYSRTQEALKSPNFDMQGAGGVGLGQNTTLGSRFGYYADLMRRQIAAKWNTAGMSNDGRRVLMTFSIQRDGTVQAIRVAQPSGNYALDTSAQRAILEASPLPQLPSGFQENSAQVELWFQVK